MAGSVYYEQIEEVLLDAPQPHEQQADVFVHVYLATPLGDTRIAYQRFTTQAASMRPPLRACASACTVGVRTVHMRAHA